MLVSKRHFVTIERLVLAGNIPANWGCTTAVEFFDDGVYIIVSIFNGKERIEFVKEIPGERELEYETILSIAVSAIAYFEKELSKGGVEC